MSLLEIPPSAVPIAVPGPLVPSPQWYRWIREFFEKTPRRFNVVASVTEGESYNMSPWECVPCVVTGVGGPTITLPPLSRNGIEVIIKNVTAQTTAFTISVNDASTETIDGSTSQQIASAYGTLHLLADAKRTEWLIL